VKLSLGVIVKEENDDDNEEDDSDNNDGDNDDEGNDDEEEDNDVAKELYGDLNITQGLGGIDLTNAQQGPLQSSSILSDYTSKILNLDDSSLDINSLMNTLTVPPPPPLFDQRVSALETKVSEFNQTSQFAKVVSLIPGIVNNYLASKLKEEVNVAIRLQSNKLKEEAEAKNQEFINQVDSTMKKIIKEQVKAQVSKIIPQIKDHITESLGEVKMIKTRMKAPSLDQIEGQKDESQHKSFGKSTQAEEPEFEAADIEMHQDQGNESGHIDDQLDNVAAHKHDWFQKPNKPSTPNYAWYKSKSVDFIPPHKWICTIATECYKEKQPPRMFNELIGTPIDFLAFVMNRLKIDNITQEILVGPTFNLLKGTCKSFAELKYHFEECYKAVNDRLDWHDPEGHEYLFDLEIYNGYCTRIASVKDTRYPIGTSLAIAESIVRELRDHSDCRTSTRTNTQGKFYRLENGFQTQSSIGICRGVHNTLCLVGFGMHKLRRMIHKLTDINIQIPVVIRCSPRFDTLSWNSRFLMLNWWFLCGSG
nr:hypothetical protein [Tanacetum cinerariifolium]